MKFNNRRENRTYTLTLFAFLALLSCSCSDDNDSSDSNQNPPAQQRSFYMGFTPWPYDATVHAVADTYLRAQNNGDIIAHHIMDGIPWQEAFDGTPYPAIVEDAMALRLANTQSNKAVFLAIESLNSARTGPALSWTDAGVTAQPPWDSRGFDHADVIAAYTSYALNLISRFNPAYFNYGTEISELMINDPLEFDRFVVFAGQVYNNIKTVHPDLPLMVSIALKTPGSADAATINADFSRIADYVDVVGISVYPYAFFDHAGRGDPANLPSNWLSQISSLAGNKPLAVTETGWIAENLSIAAFSLSVQSDPQKQQAYATTLLNAAQNMSMRFVIWFSVVDFDALWNGVLGQDNLSAIWKDTGLYDELLQPRPALQTWTSYLDREKTE